MAVAAKNNAIETKGERLRSYKVTTSNTRETAFNNAVKNGDPRTVFPAF
jgi:hypothetical protein